MIRKDWCNSGRSETALLVLFVVTLLLHFLGCGGRKKVKLPPPIPAVVGWSEKGVASWYGHPYHGRITSNGERYDMNKISAAHKSLPFDTWVRVRNRSNGKHVDVRINDRGPFVKGRIIDLSRAAAKKINMIGPGTAKVVIKVIAKPGKRYRLKRNVEESESSAKKMIAKSSSVLPATSTHVGSTKHWEDLQDADDGAVLSDPCSPGTYFGVQLGAFSLIDNAELLLDKMANSQFEFGDVQIIKSQLAQGVRYRVITGRFPDAITAKTLKKQLQNSGIDGFVAIFEPPPPTDCQVRLDR
tara:strand:+ start:93310 stop:94206 length:897 start_codon:yes stop_codon:yes gene_type:complete